MKKRKKGGAARPSTRGTCGTAKRPSAGKKAHQGRLHDIALKWLMDRANPVDQGGLGVFADTRFCLDLTKLLQRVERAAVRRSLARLVGAFVEKGGYKVDQEFCINDYWLDVPHKDRVRIDDCLLLTAKDRQQVRDGMTVSKPDRGGTYQQYFQPIKYDEVK